ncbi:MAG: NAD(P)/FAD-dependent oxidoreductase [Anaerolineales bacterium]|nr:NAD(P)/FAD-dependent oxidoreductase [Anaerolineales bacterium]
MPSQYVIIGNGAAGVSAAETIRGQDETGRITIISDEPYPLYSRPGIAYLILDQIDEKQIFSRKPAFYEQNRFELLYGRVSKIDPLAQRLVMSDGKLIPYDVLLLAVGAGPVPAPFPGADLEGVVSFDTLQDVHRVKKLARKARQAVVVGGGITAMELAEGFNHHRVRTHILQRGTRIWPRLFNQAESDIIEQQIRHEGIQVHYREEVAEAIGRRGKVAAVRLKSGQEMKCQLIGVAIGVRPNLALVRELPIETDRGILVDEYMQTSCANIFAAGDVAQVYDRWTQAHHLDILWPSAISEGRQAGYNMVAVARGQGQPQMYQKGSPFNAAMLFGLHVTVIGRMGEGEAEDNTEVGYLSRGSSHVWTAPFSTQFRSAYDRNGPASLRLVISDSRIVGALLIGNQQLADTIRDLVEKEVNIKPIEEHLLSGNYPLPELLQAVARQREMAFSRS